MDRRLNSPPVHFLQNSNSRIGSWNTRITRRQFERHISNMLGRSGLIWLRTGFHKYGDVFHFTWLSLCVAPSGLDFRWRRFPGLPVLGCSFRYVTSAITHAYYMLETDHSIMSLLHRRFAAPDLKPRRGATYQPRAEAAKRPKPWVGITEIEALKGRHNTSP